MTDDLGEVIDAARDVFAREWPSATMHRFFDGDDAAEERILGLAGELGWLMAPLPEAEGGLGLGIPCAVALLREAGRVCAPGAIFAALAGDLWLCTVKDIPGSEACAATLTAAGHRTLMPGIDWTPLPFADGRVNGRLEGMIGGRTPSLALLPLRTQGGGAIGLFRVGPGVRFERGNSWDATRAVGWLRCEDAVPLLLVPDEDGRLLARLVAAVRLAVAADSMGGADAALEATRTFALEREQFGRRIGSFQAVKHRIATMRINCEVPEALLRRGAQALTALDDDAGQWAAMARMTCAEHYRFMADESVLLYGGIGYTWQMDAHVRVKRAGLNALLCGNGRTLRDEIFVSRVADLNAEGLA